MNIRLILASTIIGLSLVACNGGGSAPTPTTTTVTPTATPGATASPGATAEPVASESVVPVITNGVLTPTLLPTTLADLGLTSGPTISLPNGVTPPATLPSVTYSNASPPSITTFSHGHTRKTKQVASLTVPGATALVYTSFQPASTLTLPPGASSTFTYPLSTTPAVGTQYNLAFFDGNQWNADTNDVGVVTGNTVTVTAATQTGGDLTAGTTFAVVLYSTSNASPAPSSTPSAAASPLASGTLSIGTSSTNDTGALSAPQGSAQGSVTLPGAYSAGNLNYSITSAAPSGVTPPSNVNTVYGYAALTPASTLTWPVNSTVQLSLTAAQNTTGIPNGNYSFAYSKDGQTWVTGIGSSTINHSDTTVTLTASNSTNDLQLVGGSTYYVAVYQ